MDQKLIIGNMVRQDHVVFLVFFFKNSTFNQMLVKFHHVLMIMEGKNQEENWSACDEGIKESMCYW